MWSKNPEWKLAGIFADEGITGTQAKKRPEFLKMIRLCRQGKIDMILTKSLSRFARNTVDSLDYIRELKTLGIAVISEKENINTLTAESEMLITIMSCFAQAESESISKNVAWGVRQSFKNGNVPIQYKKLLGYKKGKNDLPEIIPEEAEIVKEIFRRYLDGSSMEQIADCLNEKGLTTKGGDSPYRKVVIQATTAVSDCESVSEEVEEELEEQESPDFSDDFDSDNEETEHLDEDKDMDENEDQEETEDMGMSMGM